MAETHKNDFLKELNIHNSLLIEKNPSTKCGHIINTKRVVQIIFKPKYIKTFFLLSVFKKAKNK